MYGTDFPGEPLVLAILGDSSAAGLGVDLPRETPGALLAAGLAQVARRPVRVVCAAVVGAESAHLHPQVEFVLAHRPDAAAILIGGNDVTHRVRPQIAVGHLVRAVRPLVDANVEVTVGTCPDLGTIQPIQPPLRWVARQLSRQLAAAQTIAIVEAGGRSVSLGDLLGPEFAARPGPDVLGRPVPPLGHRVRQRRRRDAPLPRRLAGLRRRLRRAELRPR